MNAITNKYDTPLPKLSSKIIEREETSVGGVKRSVYWHYLNHVGLSATLMIALMQILYQMSAFGSNVWLSVWTDETYGDSGEPANRDLYLGVYGALGVAQAIATGKSHA